MAHASCKANCVLVSQLSASNQVLGSLKIIQQPDGSVKFTGTLQHLQPGKHGLSICQAGDLSQGATSCGPVFNPFGM